MKPLVDKTGDFSLKLPDQEHFTVKFVVAADKILFFLGIICHILCFTLYMAYDSVREILSLIMKF